MQPFQFNTAPLIVFGRGRIGELGALTAARSVRRVFVVTDPGLIRLGLVDAALASLDAAGIAYAVFSDIEADPPEACVLAAAQAARDAEAEAVIGFGGGSSLDVAKLVALLAGPAPMPLAAMYGVGNAKGPRLPLILVPTTSGTGSEVTPIAIVTTGAAEKMGVVAPALLPDLALLDPALTDGLPPAITAATGIDAMVHAIEAHASAGANNNPVSKALAREALCLMGGALERAVVDGRDSEARDAMLLGSLLAGQAFANSPVAAVHALAYPIGGHFHVPHGLSNALVLPHVLRFNIETVPDAYAAVAPCLFPAIGAEPDAFPQALASLAKRCGLPTRLRDVGIPEEALGRMAADAMNQTRLLVNNPRPVTEADALAIYRDAW